ncbi:hypothetical protein ILUMI_09567 [Ignelater luminosus]|uniref:CCHC-type domain-containing protein n=1 Tax=Ignelater luminosus TaxID=2038154 RepID=A0A8K0GCA8_IGNLU|nr:hypothetical protein ILUMI_09567 [Ignelater luminosus]
METNTPVSTEGRKKKRRACGSPSGTATAVQVAPTSLVEAKYSELIEYIDNEMDPGKRLSKIATNALKQKIAQWALAQAELLGEIKQLTKNNNELKQQVSMLQTTSTAATPQLTYAKIAQTKVVANSNRATDTIPIPNHVIFITSKTEESGKTIQQKLTEKINPKTSKIKIKAMRTTSKALVIEGASQNDLETIANNPEIQKDLKCEMPRKSKPLLIMYDISAKPSESELTETIYYQNLAGQMSIDEFKKQFALRFKTGPKNKTTVHHVCEVTGNLRKILLRQERIYIGFHSIKIRDYTVVPRCLKCQDLGHVGKHCTQTEQVCGHCGKTGHVKNNCDKKAQKPVCIPCRKRGKRCSTEPKDCSRFNPLPHRTWSVSNLSSQNEHQGRLVRMRRL